MTNATGAWPRVSPASITITSAEPIAQAMTAAAKRKGSVSSLMLPSLRPVGSAQSVSAAKLPADGPFSALN